MSEKLEEYESGDLIPDGGPRSSISFKKSIKPLKSKKKSSKNERDN